MIVIPSTIESISTRADGSIKIVIGTQELSPEKVGILFMHKNKLGYVAIKEANFQPDEIDALTDIDEDLKNLGKTASQRMRNVLFILFKQSNEGHEQFNDYYNHKMNTLIEHFKSKIIA
jgi:hypothetical protein